MGQHHRPVPQEGNDLTDTPTAEPEKPDFAEIGRKLFAAECEFIWGASKPDGLPPVGPPEIAFAGRSNVGKSSLLNALTNRKTLARTSHTPGRTQQLNFFALGPSVEESKLRLVDMPGYGFASASKTKISSWNSLMNDFLRGRAPLARVFVLIDGRHGLKPVDYEMFDVLDRAAMSYQIVLTKKDEVKISEREKRIAETVAELRKRIAAFPDVIFTSSETGEGVPELREAVALLLHQRGA
jgi:GTP-binding protein